MTDTIRTQADLLALAADNTTGAISAQDLRDIIISAAPIRGTADPSAAAGVAAALCSVYMRTNAAVGELWFKTGAADTAWTKIV
jgi:hypothetical protein